MIKQKSVILFLIFFAQQSLGTDDAAQQSKKLAVEIIASLSNDILALVESKEAKNPELTKVCVVQLITNLAQYLADIIMKIKERKNTRNIHDELSDQEYAQVLESIISRLCRDFKSAE